MKKNRIFHFLLISLLIWVNVASGQRAYTLAGKSVKIAWTEGGGGWKIDQLSVKKNGKWLIQPSPSGEYTLLFSEAPPDKKATEQFEKSTGGKFPEDTYHYQKTQWEESTNSVALNTAGTAYHFYPRRMLNAGSSSVTFVAETDKATITTEWKIDPNYGSDIQVKQTLTPKTKGYFSLATPTATSIPRKDMEWATVPGYFQSNYFQKNFAVAYAYGHGVPEKPAIFRERSASTLSPIVSSKNGITFSVIADPGLARDPWVSDKKTHADWFLGLSHMNRKSELMPTLYYPVLGEDKSFREAGQSISYGFRYHFGTDGWFSALKHAIYNVYRFKEAIAIRKTTQSLTDRIEKMHHYLRDPKTSLWNTDVYKGLTVGAQSYRGGVVGSQGDAIKNSDYGAMWMLAGLTNDQYLKEQVLAPALNFKLVQQQTTPGFFEGAVEGQYYLMKRKMFVEEWGDMIEPIAVTYYIMLDVGNMLLFDPDNQQLKDRLRLGAERLLAWQKKNGAWAVAYDHKSEAELFEDINDLRSTFYGLVVAYRILGDEKYLAAARKGADWLITEGVNKGSFLGVCGDARYAPDFATAQTAQTLLDLYDITKEEKYKKAAIESARIYINSIYTHPIPTHAPKTVKGIKVEDWQISQVGLGFEHGTVFGSAYRHGPITLASHAGLFLRIFDLTKDPVFADMARAAAIGRDFLKDPKTSVATYYWDAMNQGAGAYPHHAWWQIGWLTDYLLSEASTRSGGKVAFPRGFVTPKVGPHQSYGFKPGEVYGDKADLMIQEGLVATGNPSVDYLLARSKADNTMYVILLNNDAHAASFDLKITPGVLKKGGKVKSIKRLSKAGGSLNHFDLPAFGIVTLAITIE